jgi:hypothetical protein
MGTCDDSDRPHNQTPMADTWLLQAVQPPLCPPGCVGRDPIPDPLTPLEQEVVLMLTQKRTPRTLCTALGSLCILLESAGPAAWSRRRLASLLSRCRCSRFLHSREHNRWTLCTDDTTNLMHNILARCRHGCRCLLILLNLGVCLHMSGSNLSIADWLFPAQPGLCVMRGICSTKRRQLLLCAGVDPRTARSFPGRPLLFVRTRDAELRAERAAAAAQCVRWHSRHGRTVWCALWAPQSVPGAAVVVHSALCTAFAESATSLNGHDACAPRRAMKRQRR